jgi:hypothetical protein
MARIHINWLSDTSPNCETCGTSYAEGAIVRIDDELVLALMPSAHCFGGDSWDQHEVYRLIFEKLGHTVEY